MRKRHWITEQMWDQWDTWLKATCQHPIFADVWKDNAGMFDRDFEGYVEGILPIEKSKIDRP